MWLAEKKLEVLGTEAEPLQIAVRRCKNWFSQVQNWSNMLRSLSKQQLMMHKPCIPYIEDVWTFFVAGDTLPACSKRMSKENAKGWLPSWIRHRLVESWSNQNVSHRHFSFLLQRKDCGISFLYRNCRDRQISGLKLEGNW